MRNELCVYPGYHSNFFFFQKMYLLYQTHVRVLNSMPVCQTEAGSACSAEGLLGSALGINVCRRKGRKKQDWSEGKVGVWCSSNKGLHQRCGELRSWGGPSEPSWVVVMVQSFYTLRSTSHWMQVALGRGYDLGWSNSLLSRQFWRVFSAGSTCSSWGNKSSELLRMQCSTAESVMIYSLLTFFFVETKTALQTAFNRVLYRNIHFFYQLFLIGRCLTSQVFCFHISVESCLTVL